MLSHRYEDYLLSSPGVISAVDLSEVLNKTVSHDHISRMLYNGEMNDKKLYLKGKRLIKSLEVVGKKVVIIDDSIQPKPYSAVNGLVAYHYDHSQHNCVKGINFISAVWADEQHSVPLSMETVKKEWVWDNKKQAYGWQIIKTKNAVFRRMVQRLTYSKQVAYVLADSWYGSKENMEWIKMNCKTDFVLAVKSSRLVARSAKDAKAGRYKPLEALRLGKCAVKLYFKELDFPVVVVKTVFKNGDDSSGALYLACSNLQLDYSEIFSLYKRRWRVEEYHKSLKQNCSLGECQASSHTSQQSHFYLAVMAFLQLEKAKAATGKNHFALRHDLTILTTKYGMKAVKENLHITHSQLKPAA